jgi:hypothetical protein
MVSKRKKPKDFSRKENTRDEKKVSDTKDLLTFSFKDFDESQPLNNPQSFDSWAAEGTLKTFLTRLKDLSNLTRDEAINQSQIKIYGDFPPSDKTDFHHPSHVDINVAWGVIKAIGNQKCTVAGYIVESTFYVVFLDKDHRFWISTKKHT